MEGRPCPGDEGSGGRALSRSEEHTSELQSLMRISYAVFCLKKKKMKITKLQNHKIVIRNQVSHQTSVEKPCSDCTKQRCTNQSIAPYDATFKSDTHQRTTNVHIDINMTKLTLRIQVY